MLLLCGFRSKLLFLFGLELFENRDDRESVNSLGSKAKLDSFRDPHDRRISLNNEIFWAEYVRNGAGM